MSTVDGRLSIAVISDLHAYDIADPQPSHLCTTAAEGQPLNHPVAALLALFQTEAMCSDLLVCPGDIGDKARPAGIQYSWHWIQKLRTALGQADLAITPGNHDIDSRHVDNDPDPHGVLLGLVPPFPLDDESSNNKFWSRHYVILERPKYRLLLLNSAAYHGGPPKEFEHGHVSERTVENIRVELEQLPRRSVNILVCHHHPQQQMELRLGDYDVMKNGQLLLDVLGGGQFGEWLIVHGHKHHPKLVYASGGSSSPVVLSAASLCSVLYPELSTHVRNQFHLIEMDLDHVAQYGLVGTVRSWNWATGLGWDVAAPRSGLPATCGFGLRGSLKLLARRLATVANAPIVDWSTVRELTPEIDYLVPRDFDTLVSISLPEIGWTVDRDDDGAPVQIVRANP